MTDSPYTSDARSGDLDDPIVSEVRAQRDSIAAALDYDLDALFERVKKREDDERDKGRVILPKTPSTPDAAA